MASSHQTTFVPSLTGNAPLELWNLVAAQIDAEGFAVRRGDSVRPTANGETN